MSTMIGCAWKSGQSFLTATLRVSVACLRWVYHVSASDKALLIKNMGLCFRCSSSLNKVALTDMSETTM